MIRITLLTDGKYAQCEACVGHIVSSTPFETLKGVLIGYDVQVTELNRVGATFNLEDWEDDATLFFSVEQGEVEETQDEYR